MPAPLDEAWQLTDNAAVRLFVERVRAVDPSFQIGPANAADVVAIIMRLDGLPLALEIAAPWLPLLSAAGLLARLDHPLDVSSRTTSADPRHRSMRDTIAWGYQLQAPAGPATAATHVRVPRERQSGRRRSHLR